MIALASQIAGCQPSNPFFENYNTPFETPSFNSIELEHYKPAFEKGIEQARENIAKITSNTQEPTFENTIVALENSQPLLTKVANVFYNLNSCHTSDQMEQLSEQIQPMMSELSNDISLDPILFQRVKTVYDNRSNLDLSAEQYALLENTYKGFARSGAELSEQDKQTFRQLSTELAGLTIKFSQNVLAATNAFTIDIAPEDSVKVADLPDFVKETLAADAKQKGLEGWSISLQYPSFGPFMTYSSNRELKELLWRKYNSRANEDNEQNNTQIVKRIAELRLKLAQLMGFNTYADYVLEERMAESATNVNDFLEQLYVASRQYAIDDFEAVKDFAISQGFDQEFSPWDFGYWSEKYKTAKYALNDELVKPYLKLENVKNAIFLLAEKLYGLQFKPTKDIEVYHPDVETFEVYDSQDRFMAIFYMDFFPRESKRAGAWMTSFRDLYKDENGKEIRPLVSICTNFTKPTETSPSLLTFYEFTTLLHEFGHALHGILAEGEYASTTGTNVYRDFVELPSQLLENWATEKEFLDLWAVHYQTGEKMPEELIEKIINSKNFLAGYANMRQLTFAVNDMAWHSISEPVSMGVEEFENNATKDLRLHFPSYDGMSVSTAFSHIFAGGYAAGYYSYKWAEVLEADAFSLFKEKGIFNKEVAESFRANILSKGGSEHPMKLYTDFRGHKPDINALLIKMGINIAEK